MNDSFPLVLGEDLKNAKQPKDWIWDGLLGPRQLSLLTSVCKMGKTTLVSHLLAARKTGGAFIGRAVRAGRSVVVSEEPDALWHDRAEQLGLRADDYFLCRRYPAGPSLERWRSLVQFLTDLRQNSGIDLAIIDSLAYFLPPGAENLAALAIQSLMPLRLLCDTGVAVLLVHHPRKEPSRLGLASRGTTVLPGFADIIMEMYPVSHLSAGSTGIGSEAVAELGNRQRRLLSFSRFAETPRVLLFELSADGSRFASCPEPPPPDEFNEQWQILRMVLEDADRELTRQEIGAQWPTTYLKPKETTLWRWLHSAHERGLVRIEGDGRRADPFRYYLPEKMDQWKKDPMYEFVRMMEENSKKVQAMLGKRPA